MVSGIVTLQLFMHTFVDLLSLVVYSIVESLNTLRVTSLKVILPLSSFTNNTSPCHIVDTISDRLFLEPRRTKRPNIKLLEEMDVNQLFNSVKNKSSSAKLSNNNCWCCMTTHQSSH